MATVVNFHGKNCIEPGSYAATVYSPTSVVNVAEFGNCVADFEILDADECANVAARHTVNLFAAHAF